MKRGATRCPHCHAVSAAGAAFCILCGAALQAGSAPTRESVAEPRAWQHILWIIVRVMLMLVSLGLAFAPAPSLNRMGGYRWIFAGLGWRGTWIALACILAISLIIAACRSASRMHGDVAN